MRFSGKSAIRPAAVLAAAALAACDSPVAPSTDELVPSYTVGVGEPKTVTVCKVVTSGASGPYDFTVEQAGGREGSLPVGSSFSLSDGECVVVWVAAPNPPSSDPLVTVTATEVSLPAGMQLDSVKVVTPITENPDFFAGPGAWAQVNYFHEAIITFYNSETPTPPLCVGLTPGYWKNWKNHYTEEQFLSLLAGTLVLSTAEAEAILGYNGKDALGKLAKFVLANQLTLNLTGTDLPNPDDAGLTLDCTVPDAATDLGAALELAMDMLANPGLYSDDEVLAVKDFLDAIANQG